MMDFEKKTLVLGSCLYNADAMQDPDEDPNDAMQVTCQLFSRHDPYDRLIFPDQYVAVFGEAAVAVRPQLTDALSRLRLRANMDRCAIVDDKIVLFLNLHNGGGFDEFLESLIPDFKAFEPYVTIAHIRHVPNADSQLDELLGCIKNINGALQHFPVCSLKLIWMKKDTDDEPMSTQ